MNSWLKKMLLFFALFQINVLTLQREISLMLNV